MKMHHLLLLLALVATTSWSIVCIKQIQTLREEVEGLRSTAAAKADGYYAVVAEVAPTRKRPAHILTLERIAP